MTALATAMAGGATTHAGQINGSSAELKFTELSERLCSHCGQDYRLWISYHECAVPQSKVQIAKVHEPCLQVPRLTELLDVAGVAAQERARRLAPGEADGAADGADGLPTGEHVQQGGLAAAARTHLRRGDAGR